MVRHAARLAAVVCRLLPRDRLCASAMGPGGAPARVQSASVNVRGSMITGQAGGREALATLLIDSHCESVRCGAECQQIQQIDNVARAH